MPGDPLLDAVGKGISSPHLDPPTRHPVPLPASSFALPPGLTPEDSVALASTDESDKGPVVQALIDKILSIGVDGVGPLKGARQLADEHLAQYGDPEKAIRRLIATHARLVGATGFATGVGGLVALPVAIPTDIATFYALSARCAAAVAHLRGYDIDSDEVRSIVLLTLLGAGGAAIATEVGVQIGNKAALAALRKLPGRVLIDINKKVGFRLVTKFGEKGVINLVKVIPLAGGGVGAGVNVAAMRTVGRYSKSNFPSV